MTAKEYLQQIRTLDIKIKRKQQQVEELKTKATHITTMFDDVKVQSGSEGDRMADIVARWVAMENQLVYMTDELIRLKAKIVGEIETLEDDRYIQVLELRYVDRFTFERIADIMCFDVRYVYRIHGHALQAFTDNVMKAKARAVQNVILN